MNILFIPSKILFLRRFRRLRRELSRTMSTYKKPHAGSGLQPNVIKLSNFKKYVMVAQASCLCETTGKMPVPPLEDIWVQHVIAPPIILPH